MNENYNSSIINKYGDLEYIQKDKKALYDILSRQGNSLLIDCMAEYFGNLVIKFKLSKAEIESFKTNIIIELQDALNERT